MNEHLENSPEQAQSVPQQTENSPEQTSPDQPSPAQPSPNQLDLIPVLVQSSPESAEPIQAPIGGGDLPDAVAAEVAPVAGAISPQPEVSAPADVAVTAELPNSVTSEAIISEVTTSEAAPAEVVETAKLPEPAASGEATPATERASGQRPPRGPRSEQRGGQRRNDQRPRSEKAEQRPRSDQKGEPRQSRNDQMAYRPEHILQRMHGKPGVFRAYLHEAEALLYQIRLVGLGPSLAVLLSQTEHKSKRRIYWDISKWVFKEQRIKGKNVRSLMESIVYGDPRFLLKSTHSVVNFLEELVRLSQQETYQPQLRSNSHDRT
ncbi:MAG: hypothetical protein CVV27_07430 [Candidatus Melainabacteria bacterium HGW-Melainabacteria-1]|nr:MAG: hypothetical protein CVV27_07430 [Candidatus Melainabacteria bacterium HGW-Melainabacteria-1]